jgi:hypothetical protein
MQHKVVGLRDCPTRLGPLPQLSGPVGGSGQQCLPHSEPSRRVQRPGLDDKTGWSEQLSNGVSDGIRTHDIQDHNNAARQHKLRKLLIVQGFLVGRLAF